MKITCQSSSLLTRNLPFLYAIPVAVLWAWWSWVKLSHLSVTDSGSWFDLYTKILLTCLTTFVVWLIASCAIVAIGFNKHPRRLTAKSEPAISSQVIGNSESMQTNLELSKFFDGINRDLEEPVVIDLKFAKAKQDAERYKNARDIFLLISAIAICVLFVTEITAFSTFRDWLSEHSVTEYQLLQSSIKMLAFIFMSILILFWIPGIFSLYADTRYRVTRSAFLAVSVALLFPPLYLREGKYIKIIILSACIYIIFRILAVWAYGQKPDDWKIILAEKRRFGWGPKQFALALTQGRASDGNYLAIIASHEDFDPEKPFFTREKGNPSLAYKTSLSLLTLTIKQRFPHSNITKNWDMLLKILIAEGCTPVDRELLSNQVLCLHPEVEDRVMAIIGYQ